MDDDDVHLCLACNQTIIGLVNYIIHKKSQCRCKKSSSQKNGGEISRSEIGRETSNSVTGLSHSYSGEPTSQSITTGTLTEIISNQFITSSTISGQRNYIFSTAGQHEANTVLSETGHNYLSAEKNVPSTCTMDFSLSGMSSLATCTASNCFSSNGGMQVLADKQQSGVNSFISMLDRPTSSCNMPTESICTDSTISAVSLSQSVSLPEMSVIDMQHTSSTTLCSTSPPGSSTDHALSIDIHSPLSRFINANLSPVSGVVSPNSVMPQTSVGNCEDFFQSLELQSKSQHNSKAGVQGRQAIDEDEMDLDLPISRILSSLDFSSDEDLVDFPLDGSFGDISDGEDGTYHPPSSHTGGKWKPGEGPVHLFSRKPNAASRWRKGAYVGGRVVHGGKWKPGMSGGKHKDNNVIQDKVYACDACEVSFHNRFQYSHHCSTQSHKLRRPGKSTGGRKGYHCSVCRVSLPSRFAYSHHCRRKSHKFNVKCQESASSEMQVSEQGFKTDKPDKSDSAFIVCDKTSTEDLSSSGNSQVVKGQTVPQKENDIQNGNNVTVDSSVCEKCGQCFENRTDFWIHCEVCKINSPMKDTKRVSVGKLSSAKHAGEDKIYTCTICSHMFRNRFAYSRHQGLCKTKNTESHRNSASMDTNKEAELSVVTKHSDDEKKPDVTNEHEKPLVIRLYYCSNCKHSFKSRLLYHGHCALCKSDVDRLHHVTENSQHCCCCSCSFNTDKELIEHCRTSGHKIKESQFMQQLEGIFNTENVNNLSKTEDENNDRLALVERQEQSHKCLVCNKSFNRLYDIVRHLLTRFHRNRAMNHPQVIDMLQKYHRLLLRLSPYQCGVCQFFFNRETDFKSHITSDLHIKNCSAIVGQIACVLCKYSTYDHQSISEHVASESHQNLHRKSKQLCIVKEKKRQIKCQYCGIVMDSRKRMRKHVSYRHSIVSPGKMLERGEGRNDVVCPSCGKTFVSPSDLAVHVSRVHLNSKPYACKVCEKSYKSKLSLVKHLRCGMHLRKMRKKAAGDVNEAVSDSYVIIENDVAVDVVEAGLECDIKSDNADVSANDGARFDLGRDQQKDEEVALKDESPSGKMIQVNVVMNGKSDSNVNNKSDSSLNYMYFENETEPVITEKMFRCDNCITRFVSLDDLREHVENEHPENVFTCDLCGSMFLSRKAFRIHCSGKMHQDQLVSQGSSQSLFKCSECSKQFSDEKWRNFHFQYQHNHINSEESLADIQRGKDEVSQRFGSFLGELYYLPNSTQITCLVCDKVLKKEYLREHLRQHTGEKPFACKLCDKAFVARLSLRRHLMCHFGLLDRSCGICGKHFKKTDQYKTHMQEHMNKDRGQCHMCHICGMVFPLEKQVVHHMKRHGERKFRCPYKGCAWRFVLKCELKVHIYSHTGEKKYLCDTCGTGFATKTRLVRHARTHTQERNYHCEHCSYKAGSRTHLQRHMRIHLGSKPFKCPYCSYTCNTHENVRKHISKTRKHAGLKIYPCKFCLFGSNTGKDFRNHLMISHASEIKGLNLEVLSVFTGLYDRSEDLKHRDGMDIIPITKRKPRTVRKRDDTAANLKKREDNESKLKDDPSHPPSSMRDSTNHGRHDSSEHPICNMQSYWSLQQPHQSHWFPEDRPTTDDSKDAKFLDQGSDLLAFQRNNNVMMSTNPSIHMTGYDHLGDHNVADVVVVSSEY